MSESETVLAVDPAGLRAVAGLLNGPVQQVEQAELAHFGVVIVGGDDSAAVAAIHEFVNFARRETARLAAELQAVRTALHAAADRYESAENSQAAILARASR